MTDTIGLRPTSKAHFDGPPLSQLDTIGLYLYKRTYPRFSELFDSSRSEMPLLQDASSSKQSHEDRDVDAADVVMA